eukprot:284-Pyramimonas_sp.AAC.1
MPARNESREGRRGIYLRTQPAPLLLQPPHLEASCVRNAVSRDTTSSIISIQEEEMAGLVKE